MPTKTIKIDSAFKKAVLIAAALACVTGAYFSAKWGMVNSAGLRADNLDLAIFLTELAPSDPLPHYVAAVHLERSFNPEDIDRALKEYETAAALSPENYLYWLDLGRARERIGDPEGAEKTLRRALQLAPNYSRVQWALGNALLRQGRREEAFVEIQKAVAGDTTFVGPAALTAWQFFDGDVAQIRQSIGPSPRLDASFAGLLLSQKKFDEAMSTWDSIPANEKSTTLNEQGKAIFGKFVEAKKFRYAMRVWKDIGNSGADLDVGKISNGGFEQPVKLEGAGPFEWQIAGGLQPQIVLSSGQKHGGNNSLLLVFNTNDGKDFRTVTKLIVVEPGEDYDLEIYYNSDLKTPAVFKWEVADAEGRTIASTEPMTPVTTWTALKLRFKAPAGSDGVALRLAREGCGQVCNVSGNLWFDDISLRLAAQ